MSTVTRRRFGKSCGAAFAIAALAFVTAGCSRAPRTDPPEIRYGEDLCARCNMIVSEERFAVSSRVDTAEESGIGLVFDDVVCLFAHERSHPEQTVRIRFVRDEPSRRWIDAGRAAYVRSDAIRSPMSGGVLAAEDDAQVEALATRFQGERMDFDALRKHFDERS